MPDLSLGCFLYIQYNSTEGVRRSFILALGNWYQFSRERTGDVLLRAKVLLRPGG